MVSRVGHLREAAGRTRPWQRRLLLMVAFAVVALPLVATKAVQHRQLSPFDEWQYADRVHQVMEGDLVIRDGEEISPWGQRLLTCRGIETIVPPADCRPEPKVRHTTNSAASDPPTYFWATGAVAEAATLTGVVDNPVTAGRLVGVLWAALGMWSVWVLSRAVGATRAASATASIAVTTVPVFLMQYHYMTPHALDVPVGAFVALATLRFLRREWAWWTLVVGGFLVAFVKGTNLTVAVAMCLAMLVLALWPSDHFPRQLRMRALVGSLVLGVSSVALTGVWLVIVGAMRFAEVAPPGDYAATTLDPALLMLDSTRFVGPVVGHGTVLLGTMLMAALTGSALAVWGGSGHRKAPLLRPVAAGYVLGAVVSPIVLVVLVFVSSDQYVPIQYRYGLALWPLGLALAAWLLLRTRTALIVSWLLLAAYVVLPWWLELTPVNF